MSDLLRAALVEEAADIVRAAIRNSDLGEVKEVLDVRSRVHKIHTGDGSYYYNCLILVVFPERGEWPFPVQVVEMDAALCIQYPAVALADIVQGLAAIRGRR